jgi:ABC-type transport system involved in cytochrome c biogenesis permease subunit
MMALLVGATLFEKWHGTEAAARCIYGSTWFALCWVLVAVAALIYILQRQLYRRPVPFLIHVSLGIILLGAGITHLWGEQGTLALRQSEWADRFVDASDSTRSYPLPFRVQLVEFELRTYPGTATPMDYISHLSFSDHTAETVDVSMNHIASHHSYRFYQSGYDPDLGGVLLSVSHDPWGIAVTYVGYGLLFLSMLLALLRHEEGFRRLLRTLRRRDLSWVWLLVLTLLPAGSPEARAAESHDAAPASAHSALPKHLTRDEAAAFGRLYVLWNGRICPVQSVARDFTLKLYGRDSYRGLTAEQVFTGWYFYPSSWGSQPMIRIKSGAARRELGIRGQYASWNDYIDLSTGNKISNALERLTASGAPLSAADLNRKKGLEEASEKYNLIAMHLSGNLLHLYPCHTDSLHTEQIEWFTPADRLPATVSPEQWMFIRKSMDYVGELVHTGATADLLHTLEKIRLYQQKEAEGVLPSDFRFRSELIYNRLQWTRPVAMASLTVGLLAFLLFLIERVKGRRFGRWLRVTLTAGLCIVGLYLLGNITLRGLVSGHLPMANGYETMQLMSLCSVVLTLALCRRSALMLPFGWMLTGLTLLVSMLGQANPAVTPLVPVLASPLLCLHVVIIMLAYTLLAFVMFLGVAGLITGDGEGDLQLFSRVLLYPALFLLAAGIFVGAIWANVSWGRYWGWDPKEVWALITLLLYSLALHRDSLPAFRRPRFFHAFMVAAFLAVLMTYFGVNFLLGGMHSYANG